MDKNKNPNLNKYSENKHLCDVYNFMLDSKIFTEDANSGGLLGRAVVTTIGVFPYLMEDGTVFNELRLPEEVFAVDSLRSLQLIPVTLEHPSNFVNSDNIKDLQVGITGEDVSRLDLYNGEIWGSYKTDGTELSIPLKITRKDAIDAVKAGKRALSCGYTRDLELKEGTWCGIHYDGIQRNIRYNHVAIVDRGRAGDSARIRMDNAFIPTYTEKEKELKDEDNSIPNRRMNMKNRVIDSVSYEVDDKVEAYIVGIEKERDTAMGKLDAANIRIQNLEKEMAGMIRAEDFDSKVEELQEIKDTADKFGVAVKKGTSMLEMKKAILRKATPSLADSLDKKSEDYINGLFDSCRDFTPAKKNDSEDDDDDESEDDDERKDESDSKKKDNKDDEKKFDTGKLNERLMKKYGHR